MAASQGRNEGIHVQPEFVCQAIPNPALAGKQAPRNGPADMNKDPDVTTKHQPETPETPPDEAVG